MSEPTFEPYADRGDKIDLVIRKGKKNVYVFECHAKGGYIRQDGEHAFDWQEYGCRFAIYAPRYPFNMPYKYSLIAAQIEAMRILELLQ